MQREVTITGEVTKQGSVRDSVAHY